MSYDQNEEGRGNGPQHTTELPSADTIASLLDGIDDAEAREVVERLVADPDSVGDDELRALPSRVLYRLEQVGQEAEKRRGAVSEADDDLAEIVIGTHDDDDLSATKIVALVLDAGVVLFHDAEPIQYATFEVNGHREVWKLRSRAFKGFVTRLVYEKYEKAPGREMLAAALNTLDAIALYGSKDDNRHGKESPVYLRVAPHDDAIYLDLCDDDWRAVRIDPAGWEVVASPPVFFYRAPGMRALPPPARGGSVDDLRGFVNVANGDDFRLLVAWLVSAFNPEMPYPVLALHGEQGSAKSTTVRILRELIDPNKADLRRAVRETRDLVIAANNAWVVTLDNLSHIRQGLSDDLCRLATGGGFSTRTLYTDEEETIFDSRRPVLLNGIETVATSGDLLDRMLMVTLPTITQNERREERDLWAQFETARPWILGALLDAVASALENLPTTKLDALPRMADMARFVTAAESGLGWESGAFLASYDANRSSTHVLALEAALIGPSLVKILTANGGFLGEPTDLLSQLNLAETSDRVKNDRDWPKTARGLRGKIDRLAPDLRGLGYTVDLDHRTPGTDSRRVYRIVPPEVGGEQPSQRSQPSQAAQPSHLEGDGLGDGSSPQPSHQEPHNQAKGDGGDGGDGLFGKSPAGLDAWLSAEHVSPLLERYFADDPDRYERRYEIFDDFERFEIAATQLVRELRTS
jgi:hypothetical protein